VLLLILIGIYKLTSTHAVPMAIKYIDNQQANIKEILDEHREDRKVFTSSIQILAKRQDKIEDTVEEIKTDVRKIMEKL
jgi:F0F1-type ATP synthase membrane subunit b/b'